MTTSSLRCRRGFALPVGCHGRGIRRRRDRAGTRPLFLGRWRVAVGWIVAAFFVAIFPGNIEQFVAGHRRLRPRQPTSPRGIRLLFQPLLVVWALWSTGAWKAWRTRREPAESHPTPRARPVSISSRHFPPTHAAFVIRPGAFGAFERPAFPLNRLAVSLTGRKSMRFRKRNDPRERGGGRMTDATPPAGPPDTETPGRLAGGDGAHVTNDDFTPLPPAPTVTTTPPPATRREARGWDLARPHVGLDRRRCRADRGPLAARPLRRDGRPRRAHHRASCARAARNTPTWLRFRSRSSAAIWTVAAVVAFAVAGGITTATSPKAATPVAQAEPVAAARRSRRRRPRPRHPPPRSPTTRPRSPRSRGRREPSPTPRPPPTRPRSRCSIRSP